MKKKILPFTFGLKKTNEPTTYDQTMTDPIAPSLHKAHLIICLLHVVIYKLYPQEESRPSPPELANCRCTTHFDGTARRFGITKNQNQNLVHGEGFSDEAREFAFNRRKERRARSCLGNGIILLLHVGPIENSRC